MTQYERFELSRIDGEIAELEKKLAVKHEQRRELVNRMGLNKRATIKFMPYSQGKAKGTDLVDKGCIDASLNITSLGASSCKTCADCGLPCQHMELKP